MDTPTFTEQTMPLETLLKTEFPQIYSFYTYLGKKAPYLCGIFAKMYNEFGLTWAKRFEQELITVFQNDTQKLELAFDGYIKFAVEGMVLQKRFNKTRCYENKTYEQAALEVYQNRDYMFSLYLPGILLSHYLWRHHYLQLEYFYSDFVPLIQKHGGDSFFDIGTGTGFYSKEMLRQLKQGSGNGFDLSPFSLEYTTNTLTAWGLAERYQTNLIDIFKVNVKAPFIVNIEVLEHLEDPQSFLNHLYQLMMPKGYGFISAAINAPNADHIYLYNDMNEVLSQLEEAGFEIVSYREDKAYEPKKEDELVPINGVAIVTKKEG